MLIDPTNGQYYLKYDGTISTTMSERKCVQTIVNIGKQFSKIRVIDFCLEMKRSIAKRRKDKFQIFHVCLEKATGTEWYIVFEINPAGFDKEIMNFINFLIKTKLITNPKKYCFQMKIHSKEKLI